MQCTDADFDGFCAGTDDCKWSRSFSVRPTLGRPTETSLGRDTFVPTADGGSLLAGSIDTGGSTRQIWLARLDGLGGIEWQRTYGGVTM